jgi:hypothetical protein
MIPGHHRPDAWDGRLVSNPPSGSEVTLISRSGANTSALWGIVEQGADRWALRASSGRFLSIKRDGQAAADKLSPGALEVFSVEHRPGAKVALRTAEGAYLRPDPGDVDRLVARSAASLDECSVFGIERCWREPGVVSQDH